MTDAETVTALLYTAASEYRSALEVQVDAPAPDEITEAGYTFRREPSLSPAIWQGVVYREVVR